MEKHIQVAFNLIQHFLFYIYYKCTYSWNVPNYRGFQTYFPRDVEWLKMICFLIRMNFLINSFKSKYLNLVCLERKSPCETTDLQSALFSSRSSLLFAHSSFPPPPPRYTPPPSTQFHHLRLRRRNNIQIFSCLPENQQ